VVVVDRERHVFLTIPLRHATGTAGRI